MISFLFPPERNILAPARPLKNTIIFCALRSPEFLIRSVGSYQTYTSTAYTFFYFLWALCYGCMGIAQAKFTLGFSLKSMHCGAYLHIQQEFPQECHNLNIGVLTPKPINSMLKLSCKSQGSCGTH